MPSRFLRIASGLGLGSVLFGAVVSWPVTAALSLGTDHLKPTWDRQWYAVKSFFGGAGDDRIILYKCDWATAGNIITLKNQMNEGDSSQRSDAGFYVTGARFKDLRSAIGSGAGSAVISGDHGMLSYFESGFYVYETNEAEPIGTHSEAFYLHLENAQGLSEEVKLRILVYETEQTANRMADYGNHQKGPNTSINGVKAYQTSFDGGAMLISHIGDDMLIGSISSDAIFAWEGNDRIVGFEGDDFVSGEQGANSIQGGPGADLFFLHKDKGSAPEIFDTIHDFTPSEGDVLYLGWAFDEIWKGEAYDRSAALEHIWTEANDYHLDVFIRPPGEGKPRHVARIEEHVGFTPNMVNFKWLLQSGNILF